MTVISSNVSSISSVSEDRTSDQSLVYADFGTKSQRIIEVNYINPIGQRLVTYADIGTNNQRIIQVDFTTSSKPGVTTRKIISYNFVSGKYRRESVNWSLI